MLIGAAVAGGVACEPVGGDLNPSTVAATTDQEATQELERQKAPVAWLSCTGSYNGRSTPSSSTPSEVEVDCQGKTGKGERITVKGWAHGVVSGHCVRGDFIARVDGKVWFHLDVLGNCAESDRTSHAPQNPPPSHHDKPTYHEPQPGTTRTVTRTVTVYPPDPTCSCFQGK
ncbi:hypothetical protein [Streptomyces sp. NPDC052225]|uniref:hypothetical protein n=1 Tax=Streptomyces sp. NPDC052225 TaxID=3154949 RepID=UPI00341EA3DD